MRQLLLLLTLFIFGLTAHGQDYNNALRVGFGQYTSITYKRMITQEKGAMASFQFNNTGAQLNAIRLFHSPAFPATSSQWFFCYGYGVHLSYHTRIESRNFFRPFAPPIVYKGHYFSPGADGYVSLEYRFLKYPFTLSADYLPNFEFFGPGVFRMNLTNLMFTAAFTF